MATMMDTLKLTPEARAELMNVRDALVLDSNSIEASTIRELGRKIDRILDDCPIAERERTEVALDPNRNCALTLGMLVHAMDDWAKSIGGEEDEGNASKQRIELSGGTLNYIAKVRSQGEHALKRVGCSKQDIPPYEG